MDRDEVELEGLVKRVVYRAADGVFAVVRLDVEGRTDLVTIVGAVGELGEGESVVVSGRWEKHGTHGDQLRAIRAVAAPPRTEGGVRRYLEGLPGLGAALADRLTIQFGVAAIEVLEQEPWRAGQVRGVGKARAGASRARGPRSQARARGDGVLARPRRVARVRRAHSQGLRRRRDRPRAREPVPPRARRRRHRLPRRGSHRAGDGHRSACARTSRGRDATRARISRRRGAAFARRCRRCSHASRRCSPTPTRPWISPPVSLRSRVSSPRERSCVKPTTRTSRACIAPRLRSRSASTRSTAQDARRRQLCFAHLVAQLFRRTTSRAHRDLGCRRRLILTGGPGTGKTTVVRALVRSWEARRARRVARCPRRGVQRDDWQEAERARSVDGSTVFSNGAAAAARARSGTTRRIHSSRI